MSTTPLLPCPYPECGEKAEISSISTLVFWASCPSCGAEGPGKKTEEEAILSWNSVSRAPAQGSSKTIPLPEAPTGPEGTSDLGVGLSAETDEDADLTEDEIRNAFHRPPPSSTPVDDVF